MPQPTQPHPVSRKERQAGGVGESILLGSLDDQPTRLHLEPRQHQARKQLFGQEVMPFDPPHRFLEPPPPVQPKVKDEAARIKADDDSDDSQPAARRSFKHDRAQRQQRSCGNPWPPLQRRVEAIKHAAVDVVDVEKLRNGDQHQREHSEPATQAIPGEQSTDRQGQGRQEKQQQEQRRSVLIPSDEADRRPVSRCRSREFRKIDPRRKPNGRRTDRQPHDQFTEVTIIPNHPRAKAERLQGRLHVFASNVQVSVAPANAT